MENNDKQFYCKEWNNVGYICPEGQCESCAKADAINENQPKEEKIKRLIQREIDRYDREFWQDSSSRNHDVAFIKSVAKVTLSKLLKEIETL